MQKCSERAFALCPTRHLCGNIEDTTFTDDSECAAFNRAVEDNPMKNADFSTVRLGKWIEVGYACGETEWQCSACGETEWRTSADRLKYCPFCGARMDFGHKAAGGTAK